MGLDLNGCDRGECLLCSEKGYDCDEYVLQPDAKTTQVTACRDCLHPVATHKKRVSQATKELDKRDASAGPSDKKVDDRWKDKKLGFIAGFEASEDIFDCSSSRTKNQVIKELFESHFSKGRSVKNKLDCESFKKHFVAPEYRRRIETKRQLTKLQNKVEFILSKNPNALGYFTHPDLVLKATDKENLNKQLLKLNDVVGEIESLRKTLREHETENTVEETNGNRRPKRGLEPIITFNNDCNTELIQMESKLKDLESKVTPLKEKFEKNFAISAAKIRDKARSSKENKRKSRKRKGDKVVDEDVSKRMALDSDRSDSAGEEDGDEDSAGDEHSAGRDVLATDLAGQAVHEVSHGGGGEAGMGESSSPSEVIKDIVRGIVGKADKILKLKSLQKFSYTERNNNV